MPPAILDSGGVVVGPISPFIGKNCYACTAASLLGITTDELVARTETMQDEGATVAQVEALLEAAGIAAGPTEIFPSPAEAMAYLEGAGGRAGCAFGIAYLHAPPATDPATPAMGHMVTAVRYVGRIWFLDFQAEPPLVSDALDSSLAFVHVFPTTVTSGDLLSNAYVISGLSHGSRVPTMK